MLESGATGRLRKTLIAAVEKMHCLFAQGTLRQRCRNNGLISGTSLVGRAGTVEDYALFIIEDNPVVTSVRQ